MACHVIVTSNSMLWTLLTVLVTLVTLYSLTSTSWLSGYERPYDGYNSGLLVKPPTNESDRVKQEYSYLETSRPKIPTYNPTIGLYSRCIRVVSFGRSVMSCGSFAGSIGASNDIFPTAWQVSLVLAGVASLLLVFTAVCSVLSLCVQDFCRKSVFTICGLIQVISGLILAIAIAIYPVGWGSPRMQYFCGVEVAAFSPDQCSIGWAYITMIVCTICVFPIGMLSIKADRATSKDEIQDQILEGKHLICIK